MYTKSIAFGAAVLFAVALIFLPHPDPAAPVSKGCVFQTVFGEVELDTSLYYAPTKKINNSVEDGLKWLSKSQHPNGGWGAGSHYNQREMDPHKVQPDPATTAMVAMAILRTGSTVDKGPYASQLRKATFYLIDLVEKAPPNANISPVTNTQIQTKLGQNIDLALTTQFFSNLLPGIEHDKGLHERVFNALNKCVDNVQTMQAANGSFKGAGWAGVLQSAFANNALESAQKQGAWVDDKVLEQSKEYQKSNFDVNGGSVKTTDGAGIVLYSVSSSARAAAVEARKAERAMKKAKKEGRLKKDAELNVANLIESGMEEDEALKNYSSYQVYQSASVKAQDQKVMEGFGNNGGEEFISFLQTGESMIINQDQGWKKWFDNVSGQLLHIQNKDGSWNGHHCITSPVYCTATCVLILSINNDIEQLAALGEDKDG